MSSRTSRRLRRNHRPQESPKTPGPGKLFLGYGAPKNRITTLPANTVAFVGNKETAKKLAQVARKLSLPGFRGSRYTSQQNVGRNTRIVLRPDQTSDSNHHKRFPASPLSEARTLLSTVSGSQCEKRTHQQMKDPVRLIQPGV